MREIQLSHTNNNLCLLESGEVVSFPSIWKKELISEIREWRFMEAQKIFLPVYCVFDNTTLNSIISVMPRSLSDMWIVKGFSDLSIRRYGAVIVKIVNDFMKSKGIKDILYGYDAFNIDNSKVRAIIGFYGLLDEFIHEREKGTS